MDHIPIKGWWGAASIGLFWWKIRLLFWFLPSEKLSGSSLEGYRLPVLPTLPPFKARLVTTEEAKSGSLIGL